MQQHDKKKDPTQENNPETLAVSDEKQRSGENKENSQQVPTGNERNEKTDTAGAQAGMGE